MNTKFAYPLTDSTFKLIFGQDKHKQLTIDFLNDFLERKDTPSIQEAFHLVERLNWTPQQNRQYENEVRAMQRDITQDLAEAKELEDAIEQGQLKKAEAVALHGLQKGLDLTLIQELTGLSMEEIKALRKKIS